MIHVYFLILPNSLIMDWAGPAEALRIANSNLQNQGQEPVFALHFVGPNAQVPSSVGASIANLEELPDLQSLVALGEAHWLVVVGQPGNALDLQTPVMRTTLHWLRGLRLATGHLELMCVCAGAVIAAQAGLLAGRRVTTHHQHLNELQQTDPHCLVQSNRVFVDDGPVYSSAGISTGIDLFLYRIAGICGPAVAAYVAQTMVLPQRRGPNDPELSPFLQHRQHLHPALHRVQDAISQSPRNNWSLTTMAAIACTSPRHLCRLFEQHAGIAPRHYVRQIRLAVAQSALRSGMNVTQAADAAGFASDTQLRRAWHDAQLQGTPSRLGSGLA